MSFSHSTQLCIRICIMCWHVLDNQYAHIDRQYWIHVSCIAAFTQYGYFRKFRCQPSVLHGRYDSEVWFEVCFGGMIRGMIRSTFFTDCLHKDYILYQRALSYTKLATGVVFWRGRLGHGTAKRGLGMIRGMYRVWFGVWLGQETVSAKIK